MFFDVFFLLARYLHLEWRSGTCFTCFFASWGQFLYTDGDTASWEIVERGRNGLFEVVLRCTNGLF